MAALLFLMLLFPWQRIARAQIHSMSEINCWTSYSLPGFKIHGHVITSVSLSTISQCKHRCAAQQRCNSISFHQNTKKCEMHDGNHISHPESVLPSNGYVYVNVPTRPPKRCSHKLCSYPLLCVPENADYKCVSCEEAKAEQVLNFPRKSSKDYVILDDPPFVSMSAFTLSLWVQIDSTSESHYVFRYETRYIDEGPSIYVTNTYVGVGVFTDGKPLYGVNIVDNKWHHLCLTWENTDGHIKLYIDGVLRIQITGKKGQQLNKRSLVLGRDTDGDDWQSFHGNLASVNMWSRAFLAGEVSVLASTCPTSEGDIIQWSTLKTKGTGMTKLVCSTFCR
ncbi:pentraxin-4 [Exaiptasia diaphana]|uniref:Apple domain-containing protein n=1 Tax=Exaiptasia diaphana TaxID=2652724 RepID=A0A913XXG1_EXADI|nr:pentraxin-4 [Exaiptasia diaphana]